MKASPTIPKYIVVKVNGRAELKKFIEDLRAARDDSADTGGGYSAFLHLEGGRILQVEINPKRLEDRQ
jgi:hypothetical protein